MNRKVFAYVIRINADTVDLLVFDSLEEPGYEVPKGGVEAGESLEEALHQEVYEESGLNGLRVIQELRKTEWCEQEQYFFLAEAPSDVADAFEYQVTGEGIDTGFWYRYSWQEIRRDLEERLVQGSNRFVGELIALLCAD